MENNVGVAEDRISELPDSILHNQILSRLPTKSAVSTSILSKRWRWLWTGVPALEFSHTPSRCSDPDEEAEIFMDYVDNVLLNHQISSLRSFKLTCDVNFDESRVHSWISTVANQDLHELYLNIYNLDPYVIPMSVYHGQKSLVVLNISSRTDLTQRFFSSLPALKRLVLEGCTFHNHQKLVISVPSLNHLRIAAVVFRPFGQCSRTIEIYAPNLDYLYCRTDRLPREYILFDMPILEEALIDTELYDNPFLTEEEVCHNACNLLNHLANVKKLHITADLLMVLPHEDLMNRLPTFTNLTYLRFNRHCDGRDLLSMLRIMPNLEDLIFDKVYASSEDELTSYIGEKLPQCFQWKIKKCQINEYYGSPGDLWIINFLLTNVVALEITDIIDTRDIFSCPVKIVRLGRYSLNPTCPLSLQDLLSPTLHWR